MAEAPSWNRPERMTHTELVSEVFRLREKGYDGVRARDLASARERCARLEQELANTALRLCDAIDSLERERGLREAAEINAKKFHAQALAARIAALPVRSSTEGE